MPLTTILRVVAASVAAVILAVGCRSPGTAPAAFRASGTTLPDSSAESAPEASDSSAEPSGLLQRVARLAREGNFDEAESLLLRRMEENPADIAGAMALASLYETFHGIHPAHQMWSEKAEDGEEPLPHLLAALLAHRIGDVPGELREYAAAYDILRGRGLATDNFIGFYAMTLESRGRPDDAEKILLDALLDRPRSARLLNHLAYLWAVRDMEIGRAEALSRKSLELEPDNPAYLDTLGWICFRAGRPEEAIWHLSKALHIGGPDPEILDHLGEIFYSCGQDEAAICAWLDSLALDPGQPRVVEKLRNVCHSLFADAVKSEFLPSPSEEVGETEAGETETGEAEAGGTEADETGEAVHPDEDAPPDAP
ncbi:MAG: hypothetical protein ACOX5G_06825 [Kiritimatiellia bacterium]